MVIEAFQLLVETCPNDNLILELVTYFKSTWINGNYCLEIWNHALTIGPRTNNHSEGFHSKINKMCGHAHPNFFKFIDIFQTVEATYSVSYERRLNGEGPPKRRKCDIERDEKIRLNVNKLMMGDISLDSFLNTLIN
ncbi:unnamed protein product [Brachionus calyciflorus]|uniref:Uncharacterized protein n=1 Tax=Brachionus calyciflorus TaxID=104777 RepID=A0A813MAY2_9BILA|nr:unnamed protein product [Brachionus calyciflorus]